MLEPASKRSQLPVYFVQIEELGVEFLSDPFQRVFML
jgi:hypothetical protein